jgi:hypothetical protein
MKAFELIEAMISRHLNDPYSKALPACRQAGNPTFSPPLAITAWLLGIRGQSFLI